MIGRPSPLFLYLEDVGRELDYTLNELQDGTLDADTLNEVAATLAQCAGRLKREAAALPTFTAPAPKTPPPPRA